MGVRAAALDASSGLSHRGTGQDQNLLRDWIRCTATGFEKHQPAVSVSDASLRALSAPPS